MEMEKNMQQSHEHNGTAELNTHMYDQALGIVIDNYSTVKWERSLFFLFHRLYSIP